MFASGRTNTKVVSVISTRKVLGLWGSGRESVNRTPEEGEWILLHYITCIFNSHVLLLEFEIKRKTHEADWNKVTKCELWNFMIFKPLLYFYSPSLPWTAIFQNICNPNKMGNWFWQQIQSEVIEEGKKPEIEIISKVTASQM